MIFVTPVVEQGMMALMTTMMTINTAVFAQRLLEAEMDTDQDLFDFLVSYFDTDCLMSWECLMSAESVLKAVPELWSDRGVKLAERLLASTGRPETWQRHIDLLKLCHKYKNPDRAVSEMGWRMRTGYYQK